MNDNRVLRVAEVCLESVADALAAESGGAQRVELCRDLSVGGLTPQLDAVREVVTATAVSAVAMLRCRSGDFHYAENELIAMAQEVAELIQVGVRGVVFGAVDDRGMPQLSAVAKIRAAVDAASPTTHVDLVFHRAFDAAPDQAAALETLIELGVDRVLTSGHPDGVAFGLDRLAALVEQAGDRITVMPGGGVRVDNIAEVLRQTGAREIHFSARAQSQDPTSAAAVREFLAKARS